jgi:hypothetical protein
MRYKPGWLKNQPGFLLLTSVKNEDNFRHIIFSVSFYTAYTGSKRKTQYRYRGKVGSGAAKPFKYKRQV